MITDDERHLADLLDSLRREAPDLAANFAQRFRSDLLGYHGLDDADIVEAVLRAVDGLIAMAREQRPATDDELAGLRGHGELRADQGVPLESVMRSWQIAIREVIRRIGELAESANVPVPVLRVFVDAMLAAMDEAMLEISTGYRAREFRLSRQLDIRRDEFVRALFGGGLTPEESRREMQAFGLTQPRYATFRAVPADRTAEHVDWELRQRPGCRPPYGLTAVLDGDVVGLCTLEQGSLELGTLVVGVGPAVELDEVASSFHIAGRVASTALDFELPGQHTLAELGLLTAVTADPALGKSLSARYCDPLTTDDEMEILRTVDCYLSNGMNAAETATHMFVHHNTVRHRLSRFEELTEVRLRDPHIASQVWWALRYRQLRTMGRSNDQVRSSAG
ncbi:helix-turn-helix domain-containing protein [Nocardia sp. NPDC050435]|uniref:PucR family transcriptional regulator n=1 Tax=Nocardia sp. NPDC050435 TaxID=3155040 RepID=UPI003409680B